MSERTPNSEPIAFRSLSVAARRLHLAEQTSMSVEDVAMALDGGGLSLSVAEQMVENAVGTLGLPMGIAVGMRVNDRDYLVPMAIEEPSVIAAASHAAKRVRSAGGFRAECDASVMIAQVEVHGLEDEAAAMAQVEQRADQLLELAKAAVPALIERGGGPRQLEVRRLGRGVMVVHLMIDCCDAMGANLVNTIAEQVGPEIAEIAGGQLGLRILSNLSDRRCTRVTAKVPPSLLGAKHLSGEQVIERIVRASEFAENDPYRAATHNKGIMNGLDAVVVATGNDWRAVEAGAHAFAARTGQYRPLSTWTRDEDGFLVGAMEIPLALGTVGGALRVHAGARFALRVLGVSGASELAMVAAATGLASNLAALRALSTEGIQRGHMELHRRASTGSAPR